MKEASLTIEPAADGVVVITIDRPEKANSIDDPTHYLLESIWGRLERERDVRAVVLTGRGSVFCGGGDFDGWTPLIGDRHRRRVKMIENRAIIVNMLRCQLPIIAAVNGPATGLGCSLVLASDIVIMSENAYLTDPHVSHRMAAGDGGAGLLPYLVPRSVAKHFLWTGRRMTAAEARALWLAEEVTPPGAALDRAIDVATELAAQDPEALQDTKRSINLSLLLQAMPALELANATESGAFDKSVFRERVDGLTSAREKPPRTDDPSDSLLG